MSVVSDATTTLAHEPRHPSPPSRRLRTTRWRDPRLWVGLVLVAVSALVGARLLAQSDDTVGVWAVTQDLAAGAPLPPESLTVEQVRFADEAALDPYLLAGQPVPQGGVVTRDLTAGELVPRDALGAATGAPMLELPVLVGAAGAPEDLRSGEVVDVWVAPPQGSEHGAAPAARVLTAVPVVDAARDVGPLGEAATRQVLLGVDEPTGARLDRVIADLATGTVVLVRHGSAP